MNFRVRLACVLLLGSSCAFSQASPAAFDGVEKWKDSLTRASVKSLKNLYSADPPAKYMQDDKKLAAGISPEIDFWQQLISSGAMSGYEVTPVKEEDRQGLHIVTLLVSMKAKTSNGLRARYVTENQAWQQQPDGWRIVIAMHSDVVKMPPALHPNPNLYNQDADAKVEIKEAEAKAKEAQQRIILVFGANWCYDCHVLDQAFHVPDVAALLQKNFQVVHIDIGEDGKKNNSLAADYHVPLDKGVPALAVLAADGKLLYSQENGEWESARSLDPDDVISFLEKWKP
jgi:thioredoxin 1